MQSTTRVMPCCMITGQAAGMAAALAATLDIPVRNIPMELLQQRLRAVGAYLP